jgi:hypothetical protein
VIAEGYSNTPEGTSTLYTALNNSPLFSRFEPKRETEVTVSGVTAKRFEVEFHIGKQGSE